MKNAIRCCIACILPCGALDVIRIVHTNGKVEEISGTHVKAAEIMKLHPKHVLKKPSSSSSSSTSSSDEGSICPKIVIVPPDAELKRGKIYFLMPMPPSSSSSSSSAPKKAKNRSRAPTRKKKMRSSLSEDRENGDNANLLVSDQYLSDILLEKVSTQRDRRRGRVGVWRPHLESIYETPSES